MGKDENYFDKLDEEESEIYVKGLTKGREVGKEKQRTETLKVLSREYKDWKTWVDGLTKVPEQHKIAKAHLNQIITIAKALGLDRELRSVAIGSGALAPDTASKELEG